MKFWLLHNRHCQKVYAVHLDKMQKCSGGFEIHDECHKKSFTFCFGLINAAELDDEENQAVC